MRIVSVVYVDHQDAVGYPVAEVVRSLLWTDRIYILASDDRNAVLLKTAIRAVPEVVLKTEIHVVGAKVGNPGDIARAWNRCLTWMKANDDWDYLLVSPADTLATTESAGYCQEFMATDGSHEHVAQFPVQEAKLYHDFGSGYGQTLMGRKWPGRFSEECDGSKLAGYEGHQYDSRWWKIRSTLHIGYLSIELAYRHQLHEAKPALWGHAYGWLADGCRVYERAGREAFVRYMIPILRNVHKAATRRPIDEADPRFGPVINRLGLRSERDLVVKIAQSIP